MKSVVLTKLLKFFHNTKLDRFSLIKELGYKFLYNVSPEPLLATTAYGHKLFVIPWSPVGEEILKTGILEKDTTNFLLKNLTEGEVFVDVGANIGYFSCLASKLVSNSGLVVAFEPEHLNFMLLEANIKTNRISNVICEKLAVADFIGSARLFLNPAEPGGHTLFPRVRGMNYITVDVTTLDHYFITWKLPYPNIIKIDVEGAELSVLRGLNNLLSQNQDVKIIIEFNPKVTNANLLATYCLTQGLRPHVVLKSGDAKLIPIEKLKALSWTANLLLQR
jgi:FkbM family methyltransferase